MHNLMCRNQIIKMKDGKLVTIDRSDINQVKDCIEQYCGAEFSELANCILDDFIVRLKECGYDLEDFGYRRTDVRDVRKNWW
jgi:hypothetical protein